MAKIIGKSVKVYINGEEIDATGNIQVPVDSWFSCCISSEKPPVEPTHADDVWLSVWQYLWRLGVDIPALN